MHIKIDCSKFLIFKMLYPSFFGQKDYQYSYQKITSIEFKLTVYTQILIAYTKTLNSR